ncbi:MAG: glycerophosphodiester phosphodiesterase [Deltaproteobacteria bacterium]|jgi:glycerophosphoryl diester phosphodiesterase|nr:glycerophosphodiester phosphodiesterase [Deltaproteobacteria bacterium]
MRKLLETLLLSVVDAFFAARPQPKPALPVLERCKIISHRGQHDNRTVFENTLNAFDRAIQAGVWGIEFDIRWTRDLKPVVFHDRDLSRLFGEPLVVGEADFQDLRARFPMIPSLEEVLARYGRRVHLMVELKEETYPRPERQAENLSALLSPLKPVKDYHFLSLVPEMFRHVGFVPAAALLPVAETNIRTLSRLALARGYAGVAGHYLLVGRRTAALHAAAGQCVGTGYPRSANCLFREANRGVEWIFSNHAVAMQRVVDDCRHRLESGTAGR